METQNEQIDSRSGLHLRVNKAGTIDSIQLLSPTSGRQSHHLHLIDLELVLLYVNLVFIYHHINPSLGKNRRSSASHLQNATWSLIFFAASFGSG